MPTTSNEAPSALTVQQVAEALQVSAITIYRRTEQGKIPSFRIGSAVRIPTSYIDSLLSGALG